MEGEGQVEGGGGGGTAITTTNGNTTTPWGACTRPPPQPESKGRTEWVATPLLAAASSKHSTALQAPLALKDPLFCESKTSTVTPAP